MTSPRADGEAVADLFGRAIELPAEERQAFVDSAPAPESVRREVVELLAAHEESAGAPEALDAELAARIVGDAEGGDDPQAAEAHEESVLGRRIGRYRIVDRLGSGGMGVVYLAERADGAYEQRVAIKLLPPSIHSQQLARRFDRERRILARLEHPRIARLLDGGASEHGEPYLVMEYVDGRPLTEFCDQQRLDLEDRLELFLQVCEAVAYAHGRLVVHRDLKPSNVLVDGDQQVKLLDFGIAKLLGEESRAESTMLTVAGLGPYTPAYAAPEQRRDEPVTVATDVYGLGVVLYELLCGRRPETGEARDWTAPARPSEVVQGSRGGSLAASATEEVASARRSRPDRLSRRLSGDLDTIALEALREEPARRYPSVQALSDDLRRHLDERPIAARPASRSYRLRKFVGRHRLGVVSAGLIALAVAGGLVGTLWQARDAARERDAARLEASKLAATQGYLVSLFRSADPDQSLGDDVTATELVARGIERIETLAAEPAVQVDLAAVLARVALELGNHEQAELLLGTALPRATALYGRDHRATAGLTLLQGRLHFQRGQWSEAEGRLGEAIALYERLGPEGLGPRVEALGFLGAAVKNQDRLEDVVEIQQRAVELSRQTFGPRSAETANALNQLGIVLQAVNRPDDAVAALRESVEIAEEVHGDLHPDVATAMVNLANALLGQGRLREAEPYYREGIEMEIRLRGRDHPRYAVKVHNLATFLHAAGHYQEAADLHREVVEVLEEQFGTEHPFLGAGLDSLASDLAAAGKLDEALPVYERAGSILLATAGRDSSFYATHLRRLAQAYCAAGRCSDGVAPVEEAITTLSALGDAGELQLSLALDARARIRRAEGAFAEAEADLRRALEIQRRIRPPGHFNVGRTSSSLAAVLVDAGRLDEAAPLAREAVDILESSLAPGHPDLEAARSVLRAIESP